MHTLAGVRWADVVRELLQNGDRSALHECSRAPIAGFYTYGEIARTRGVRGFHNETLVVFSIA